MTMRRRPKPSNRARTVKKPIAVNRATAAPPKRAAPPLTEQFYVSVDGQLKSGYGTYQAAESAAQAIKKRFPVLQVTVYDAKEQRHTIVERPKLAVDPRKKSANRASNMTSRRRAVGGGKR